VPFEALSVSIIDKLNMHYDLAGKSCLATTLACGDLTLDLVSSHCAATKCHSGLGRMAELFHQ
jgi:hypothetical protein